MNPPSLPGLPSPSPRPAFVRPDPIPLEILRKFKVRCHPLELSESIEVAMRMEALFRRMEDALSESLRVIVGAHGALALQFFERYMDSRPLPSDIPLAQNWWRVFIAPLLAEFDPCLVPQSRPSFETAFELHWPLGNFGRHGFSVTLTLTPLTRLSCAGTCEWRNPAAAVIRIDPFDWLRHYLLGAERFARAGVAAICHHEVAHLSAYSHPHTRSETEQWEKLSMEERDTDSAYRLQSTELFCEGRAHAAMLHRLGLPWSAEIADVFGRRQPLSGGVLNCRFPLPIICGKDVERCRRLWAWTGRNYHRHLLHYRSAATSAAM